MPQWDADQYLRFASERTQPVHDLIARIRLENPRRIIDLGCGPGNSTAALRRRWPSGTVIGLDNSPEMIRKAREAEPTGMWQPGDAASWHPEEPFDLVFSNAMLQWVPDHGRVCSHLMAQVAKGGALAVQVPAHYNSPLHREILEVSADAAWHDRMNRARSALTNNPPEFYFDLLRPQSTHLEVWETTYYHVLRGPEDILEWFRGSGLRPFQEALSTEDERARFEQMLLERYRTAYPRRDSGVVLFPFRRLFFIAYR